MEQEEIKDILDTSRNILSNINSFWEVVETLEPSLTKIELLDNEGLKKPYINEKT